MMPRLFWPPSPWVARATGVNAKRIDMDASLYAEEVVERVVYGREEENMVRMMRTCDLVYDVSVRSALM